MPHYPPINWNNKYELDPRGFYLNLTELSKKEKKISTDSLSTKGITSNFLGQYQKSLFLKLSESQECLGSIYFKKNLRYIQIHNEFLFFAKKNLKCTNSYIKIWELLSFMTSIDLFKNKQKLLVFYDAEFPGNFVKGSANFFSKFKNLDFEWLASSLMPCEENTALEDIYGFYKDQPYRWLMNEKVNGDVTNLETFDYHYEYINFYTENQGVDMYVCDLGIQHNDENFHVQEKINIGPQICATLKGLSILKKDGHLLIKIFSCLEEETRKLLAMLQVNFQKVYMCKPSSSRGRNKELYIIAVGYKKELSLETIKEHFQNQTPIFENEINEYNTALYASQFFTSRQLTWLEKLAHSPLETPEKIYQKYADKYLDFLGI